MAHYTAVVLLVCCWVGAGMGSSLPVPRWTAPQPDPHKPLGGYKALPTEFKSLVFYGDKVLGSYNHNVMFDYLVDEGFFIAWKNCMKDEDCNGQRVLFSMSPNGRNWTEVKVLFPNMSTPELGATLEEGPTLHINGRSYFALWPGTPHYCVSLMTYVNTDPLDPRNCGPPSKVAVHYKHTLLMRRVGAGGELGPMFWASPEAPSLFAAATKELGIVTLDEMDAQTRADIATLGPTQVKPPCSPSDGTLKCEVCPGGCQIYDDINYHLGIANERTHWIVPSGDADVIAYRSKRNLLFASTRHNSTSQQDWSEVVLTDIPNDNSNINGGPLPDGRIYLVHDPVTPITSCEGVCLPGMRDPITVSTSVDGYTFDRAAAAVTCTDLLPTTCTARYDGSAKNPGPSYPQGAVHTPATGGDACGVSTAVTVVSPAPKELQGFYIGYSCNKEDIWVTKLEYSSF